MNNEKFDPVTSILFLAAVILGGAGNKVGVILGALVISYLPDRFLVVAHHDTTRYRFLFFGVALIVLMIFRPQGLLGARQRLLTYGGGPTPAFPVGRSSWTSVPARWEASDERIRRPRRPG